jgi:hypothetical protein
MVCGAGAEGGRREELEDFELLLGGTVAGFSVDAELLGWGRALQR